MHASQAKNARRFSSCLDWNSLLKNFSAPSKVRMVERPDKDSDRAVYTGERVADSILLISLDDLI